MTPSGNRFRTTLALCMLSLSFARSQPAEEPLFDGLSRSLKHDYLSFGILLRSVADYQPERSFPGTNGFTISEMRFLIYGKVDNSFGYLFTATLVKSPAILDARLSYRISPLLTLDMGQYKAPFSAEWLTPAQIIDCVYRSQVVNALGVGRQIGLQSRGRLSGDAFTYAMGLFNGSGTAGNANDNNGFMVAGRVTAKPRLFAAAADSIVFGLNAAYSRDKAVDLGNGFWPGFKGRRTVLGADLRLASGGAFLAAEGITARLADSLTNVPFGYYITAGYSVAAECALLVRWDYFRSDGIGRDGRLVILGCNLWPGRLTEIQVNYIVSVDDAVFKHHRVQLNAQFAF